MKRNTNIIKPTAFGQMSGKLSLSPEQAKRTFNYDIPPDAKGVVLSMHKGQQRIRALMPSNISSRALLGGNKIFASFCSHTSPIFRITKRIWDIYSRKFENCSGYNLFMQENFAALYKSYRSRGPAIRKWKKLLVSKGRLPSPKIAVNQFNIKLTNIKPKFQVGILILNYPSFKFTYLEPQFYSTPYFPFPDARDSYCVPPKHYNRIIYFFYKKNNDYSDSSNIIISP